MMQVHTVVGFLATFLKKYLQKSPAEAQLWSVI